MGFLFLFYRDLRFWCCFYPSFLLLIFLISDYWWIPWSIYWITLMSCWRFESAFEVQNWKLWCHNKQLNWMHLCIFCETINIQGWIQCFFFGGNYAVMEDFYGMTWWNAFIYGIFISILIVLQVFFAWYINGWKILSYMKKILKNLIN